MIYVSLVRLLLMTPIEGAVVPMMVLYMCGLPGLALATVFYALASLPAKSALLYVVTGSTMNT